jgi:lipopolysaccharide/colanic/teichoic acid biosynthesis glycosyltransferase
VAAVMRTNDSEREVVGYIGKAGSHGEIDSLAHLGEGRTELGVRRLIAENSLDEMILCDPATTEDEAAALANIAQGAGAKLKALAPTRDFLVAVSRYTAGQPLPLEELRSPSFEGAEYGIKRAFDILVSVSMLVSLSWLFLIVAALLKLSSRRGSVIERIPYPGRNKRSFNLFKFRTSHVLKDGRPLDQPTWIGRMVRRLGLDELPQLVNVMRGDMSLVGPRPISHTHFAYLQPWQQRRSEILPGITGLWQISGRNDTTVGAMVSLDLYYVQRWSVFLDIEILIKTIPATLRNRRGRLELADPPARNLRGFSVDQRARFGPRLLEVLSFNQHVTFDEAVRLAAIDGGNAEQLLRWLYRLQHNGWLVVTSDGDSSRFGMSPYAEGQLAKDRRLEGRT